MTNKVYTFQEIMDYHPDNIYVYAEMKRNLSVLVPFVGAGLSAFCYGTWREIIEKLTLKLTDEKSIAEIHKMLNAGEDYAKIAQFLAAKRTLFNLKNDIAAYFALDCMKADTIKQLEREPVYLLPKLFRGLILTTNFDNVLEKVYEINGKTLNILHPGHAEMLNFYSRENLEYGLFKLHGSVIQGKLEGDMLVFTEEQYKKHYKKGTSLYKTLKTCLTQKAILFLGCSLAQDKTMDVLKTVMQPGMSHYTIIDCEKEKRDEKIRELGEKQIRAILYKDGQHEAVRVILEHLLEETNPEVYGKLRIHMRTQNQNIYTSRFIYKARFTPMIGRENMLQQLCAFLKDERVFLWWMITGPGGSGKSRLVDEFICEYLPTGFSVRYIQLEEYTNLSSLNNHLTDKCLLVADYVQAYTRQFCDWIEQLAERKHSLPIRLLLIERAGETSESKDDFWGKEFFRRNEVCRSCYNPEDFPQDSLYVRKQPKFLYLDALSDKDLVRIMEEYYTSMKNLYKAMPEKVRIKRNELSTETKKILLEKLKEIDPGLHRPLYILLLTDAYLYGRDLGEWSRNEVLDYVVEHERERIRKALLLMKNDAREDEKLLELCLKIKCSATILQDTTIEKLQNDICKDDWGVLERKTDSFPSVKKFFQRIGLMEGDLILAFKPDLIGEYAVYRWMVVQERETVQDLLAALWNFPNQTAMFFKMLLNDYGDLLNEKPEYWELFFPDDFAIKENAVPMYAWLLSIAVGKCRIMEQSYRILELLDKFYNEYKNNTDLQVSMAKGLVNYSDQYYYPPGTYIIQVIDLERKAPIAKYVMEDLEEIYQEHPNNRELARILAYRLVARYTVNGKNINLSFKEDKSVLADLKEIQGNFPDDIEIAELLAMELIRFSTAKNTEMEADNIKEKLENLYENDTDNPKFALYLMMGLHNLAAVQEDISYSADCIVYQKMLYQKYSGHKDFLIELSRGIANLSAKLEVLDACKIVNFLKEICEKNKDCIELEKNLACSLANLCARQNALESEESIRYLNRLYKKYMDNRSVLEALSRGLVNVIVKQDKKKGEKSIGCLKELYLQLKGKNEWNYVVRDFAYGFVNLIAGQDASEAAESIKILEKIYTECANFMDLAEEFASGLVNLSAKLDASEAAQCVQYLEKLYNKDADNKKIASLLNKAKVNLNIKRNTIEAEEADLQIIKKSFSTLTTEYIIRIPDYANDMQVFGRMMTMRHIVNGHEE